MTDSPHSTVTRGREALARGDVRTAGAAAEERLKSDARDVSALELRYLVQQRLGETAKAVETLRNVLGIDPRADWAYNELTRVLVANGQRSEADQVTRTALHVNPRNAEAHSLLGTLLSEANDLPSGEWHFRRALELGGAQASFLTNLAINVMRQGRLDEAETMFTRADAAAPANLLTLAHWSKLYELRGQLELAQQMLDRAQAASSADAVNLLRANYLARQGRQRDALAILERQPTLNGDGLLERGRLYDRLGRFAEAWGGFVAGKSRLAAEGGGLSYNAQAVEIFFARLKRFFVRSNLELLPATTRRAETPQPIFIVGFPRSGTTMIEQVISSHSSVRAGGELSFMGDIRRLANLLFPGSEPFPENLGRSFTADNRFAATLFRDFYLARAAQYGLLEPGKAFFTDKMPFNEIWLPLLRMSFPEARIVHVVRHPLDVCVSVMSNNLTHGFNCGYRIEDTVHHLAAVFDLVQHYRRELTLSEHVLKYEAFVADQEGETRRLLEYLGLPFEAGCLSFHENRRHAPTPSYAQVTERLNDRSLDRYRHYALHLQPFLPQLRAIMAAYGYEA
ncbi:MAG TPA: sulfotransferase [Steroidobacteraceae bacterium]|nr:sulfotransferase [Steroidobacteraceae bacterium]